MMTLLHAVLLILPQNLNPPAPQPDLAPMLENDAALQQLLVVYWPPTQKGWNQVFLFGETVP
jgi:hypothetical protein